MNVQSEKTTRRQALKSLGLLGAVAATGTAHLHAETMQDDVKPHVTTPASAADFSEQLKKQINSTPMVDAHEHLPDEEERIRSGSKKWVRLLDHYLGDDFVSAGLERRSVFGSEAEKIDALELWRRVQPYWFAVKNTGYGQAARIAIRELYGIDRLDENTVPILQQRYEESLVKGLYDRVLRDRANIESCQVDRGVYSETKNPTFLFQDINISQLCSVGNVRNIARRVRVTVNDLNGWHEVIRSFFQKYGPYATAIKNAMAYGRRLDFEKVPAESAEGPFQKHLHGEPITPEERKQLEDHLFWFCVEQANSYALPVKLHTGHYAGNNSMPMSRVGLNPADISDLCIRSRETRWMFMHTSYPYGKELIAIAKQFSNAYVQMCWAWIIDPVGTKEFLKQYIVTAPANKIHLFGGDYQVVECVLGHAKIARSGLHAALIELVEERYLSQEDALELVEPLIRGNARRIFDLEKKFEIAKEAPWGVRD